MTYIVPERLYRTVDGRLVRHGDPAAAFLAHPAGEQLSDEEAARKGVLGFMLGEAMRGKPLDKAVTPPGDKQDGARVVEPPAVVEEDVDVVVGPVGSGTAVEPKRIVVEDAPPAARRAGRREGRHS